MEIQPIEGYSLSDAWFRTLYFCMENGRRFKIDRGSNAGQDRLELDFPVIRVKTPDALPMLPTLNPALNIPDPVAPGYLDDYMPYLMTAAEKPGESYTYGQRICGADLNPVPPWNSEYGENIYVQERDIWSNKLIIQDMTQACDFNPRVFLNQMELMIWTYKKKGHRNNQMTLQVGHPADMLLQDPPCLRHIDTRIQDGALHFFPYFRSWDLFGGFPANLAAIEIMKQYCAEQIGVENGEIIASSKGLHIYDYVFEIAAAIRGKNLEEFKNIIGG